MVAMFAFPGCHWVEWLRVNILLVSPPLVGSVEMSFESMRRPVLVELEPLGDGRNKRGQRGPGKYQDRNREN